MVIRSTPSRASTENREVHKFTRRAPVCSKCYEETDALRGANLLPTRFEWDAPAAGCAACFRALTLNVRPRRTCK